MATQTDRHVPHVARDTQKLFGYFAFVLMGNERNSSGPVGLKIALSLNILFKYSSGALVCSKAKQKAADASPIKIKVSIS